MSTTMDQLSSTENWPGSQSCESNTSDPKPETDQSRTYDLIAEEPEEEISRSESIEQISETQFNINNNNSFLSDKITNNAPPLMNRSIQTSQFSEITNLKKGMLKPNIKVVEPSFLEKLKKEGSEVQKPVYVLYPNYVLPNLDFLKEQQDVVLVPQELPIARTASKRRPFSCNDVESLKKKGFGHVKDWDSLNFLLPQEYRNILSEVPEISKHIKAAKPRRRKLSESSNSSQPSSGYRGSSTMLDSQNSPAPNHNPLFVYRYDSVTSSEASVLTSDKPTTTAPALPVRCVSLQTADHLPPRPPLPRGILRRDNKRPNVYETSEEDLTEETLYKRRSLQETYLLRKKRFSETEDEGVDAGTSSSSVDEHHESLRTTSPNPSKDFLLSNISDLVQLEEFLKMSGISSADSEDFNEESLLNLRSYVAKFLSLKINQEGSDYFGGKKCVSFSMPKHRQFIAPNNSPNVSAFVNKNYHPNQPKTLVDMPICEESEGSPNFASPVHKPSSLGEKRVLIGAVTDSVEQLISHFSAAGNQAELNCLGDSTLNPSGAKLALSTLCPALYAILSDGLKPSLESSFGAINNSVWQVVEASAQQGPLTKALNELVMRINSEDAITEGLVKFNAFIFGLLNVRSLDAWMSYLRTRESILKKHYEKDSLMLMAQTGGLNIRALLDGLISTLQPLALLPFQLDLLFEYRQLHLSFKRMDTYQQQLSPAHTTSSEDLSHITVHHVGSPKSKERPRSCVDAPAIKPAFKLGDITTAAKKRWSGIPPNSKLFLAYDRLAKEDDEEYTDSLETGQAEEEQPLNGNRFKKLQQKWEMLSGHSPPTSPTHSKSKIPRPITSPVRPSGIPVLISPNSKKKGIPIASKKSTQARTSRVDQLESTNEPLRHIPRPSSLPYKAASQGSKSSKITPPRRAASSSLSRKPPTKSTIPK